MNHSVPFPRAPGALINDRYELRRSVGKHGMAEDFLAFDRQRDGELILEFAGTGEPLEERAVGERMEALRAWVSLCQRVEHPNVCRIFDVEPTPWGPVILMEHVDGKTLHALIRESQSKLGTTAEEFRRIATDLCNGLAAIHAAGVVHGNLKPGAVMVDAQRAVIHRFDCARTEEGADQKSSPGVSLVGTPNYMSPERLRRAGAPSRKDDVYALALTLWEICTHRVPSPGEQPRTRAPMRPQFHLENPGAQLTTDELRQIFRALHEDPRMRPEARDMRFGLASAPGARAGQGPQEQREREREEERLFAEWAGLPR